jgi:hypothetical protein
MAATMQSKRTQKGRHNMLALSIYSCEHLAIFDLAIASRCIRREVWPNEFLPYQVTKPIAGGICAQHPEGVNHWMYQGGLVKRFSEPKPHL